MARGERLRVYRRRAYSRFATAGGTVMTAVLLTGLISPHLPIKILCAVLAVYTAVLTYRFARMATLIVNSEDLVVRQFLRDRRIRRDEVRRFVTQERPSGLGQRGHTLAVELRSGSVERLPEFFSPHRRGHDEALFVDTVAAELNQWVSAPA